MSLQFLIYFGPSKKPVGVDCLISFLMEEPAEGSREAAPPAPAKSAFDATFQHYIPAYRLKLTYGIGYDSETQYTSHI
jgi:hypothetical protein